MTAVQRTLLINTLGWIGKAVILGAVLGVLFDALSLGLGLGLCGIGILVFLGAYHVAGGLDVGDGKQRSVR
jgi:hypothetical protein